MGKRGWVRWTLGIVGAAVAVAGGATYARYKRDLKAARARMDAMPHETVETTLLPVSPRAIGAVHDAYVSNPHINQGYPLAGITVPTLVVGAVDDPLAGYEDMKAMAETIPNARMLTVAEGGHMLLGDEGRVPSEIQAFLDEGWKER